MPACGWPVSFAPEISHALLWLQPLSSEVLDSYRRSGVALSSSLSSFLPVVSLSCPLLVLTLPVRSKDLRSKDLQVSDDVGYQLVAVANTIDVRSR